jgi:hypothetical protein
MKGKKEIKKKGGKRGKKKKCVFLFLYLFASGLFCVFILKFLSLFSRLFKVYFHL